jgi:hypothetical protein
MDVVAAATDKKRPRQDLTSEESAPLEAKKAKHSETGGGLELPDFFDGPTALRVAPGKTPQPSTAAAPSPTATPTASKVLVPPQVRYDADSSTVAFPLPFAALSALSCAPQQLFPGYWRGSMFCTLGSRDVRCARSVAPHH